MKKKKVTQSVKMKSNKRTSSVKRSKPQETVSKSFKLFHDCRISVNVFLQCLYDNDYDGLIISGEPTEEQLKAAWREIYKQYSQLTISEEGNAFVDLIIDIQQLNSQIIIIDNAIKLLSIYFDKDIVDILNMIGARCDIKEDDDNETFNKKVKQIIARAKNKIIQLKEREKELEKMQKEQTESVGQEVYFDQLSALSHFFGYSVPPTIPMFQFIRDVNRMKDSLRKQKAKQNGD